ncbi:MAG: hypothetical protein ACTHKP_10790, partial [Nitrososphaeraceae archaeon]
MNKSKALPLVTIISMIIMALVLSTSDDAINNFSINNGGRILSLHTTALARVFTVKTQLSNSLKEIQIAPRFVKRNNNETSQELAGTQTRYARYSTSLTGKADKETSLNSSLINDSMPLSASLLTLMKLTFNSSNYSNHGNNVSTISSTSSSSFPQPSNRIFRREIMLQTLRANDTIHNQEGASSSEQGPRIALIKPAFTAAAYANGFYKFYKLYNTIPVGKNVTTDLNLLSVPVNASWYPSLPYVFSMLKLVKDIKYVSPDSDITIYDDAAADNGFMFTKNGSNAFDLIILGHQEYVTQKEYDNLKR